MAKEVRVIDAFMNGKCFAKVVSPKGVNSLMKQILSEDEEAMDKIAEEYRKDFGKNEKFSAYYLMYYKPQHALKAMSADFFERVYNSGIRSPYIFEI